MTDGTPFPRRYAVATILLLLVVGAITGLAASFLTAPAGNGPSDGGSQTPGVELSLPATNASTPDGCASTELCYRWAHDRNVTGSGVDVGVIDVTGFNASAPAIRDHVESTRSFGVDGGLANGGVTAHGTAAASIVARVAPDADLHLANFDTPGDFDRAVDWLVRSDVDVIVVPVTFYGRSDDGTSRGARALTRARNQGITVVTPTGNLARGHWVGKYDTVSNGTLQFDGDPDPDGSRTGLRGDGPRLELWLSWEGDDSGNYTAVVYRRREDGVEVVARSRPYGEDRIPNERLVTTLGDAEYSVAVHGPNGSTAAKVELESPTHRFEGGVARASIASPATARGVIAVGAFDTAGNRVSRYSGRGPTRDGRPGVDLVGPERFQVGNETRLVGSSAAAPYVAGVVALVLDVRPGTPPTTVEGMLSTTATDVNRPGYDLASGHGVVAVRRTLERVEPGIRGNTSRLRNPTDGLLPPSTGRIGTTIPSNDPGDRIGLIGIEPMESSFTPFSESQTENHRRKDVRTATESQRRDTTTADGSARAGGRERRFRRHPPCALGGDDT